MAETKEQIVAILMRRDKISRNEAESLVSETALEITDALDMGLGYDEIEQIMRDFLGLEMDYIFAFI